MNAPSSADERALFEAAYINNLGHRLEDFDLHFSTDTGRYDDDDIQCGWWAWNARASLGAAQVPSLNFDDRHAEVLDQLAREQRLSKTALLIRALRLYQMVDIQQKEGRSLAFQNAEGSHISLLMMGGPLAAQQGTEL